MERKVLLVALVIKRGTSVKSDILETPCMNENSNEKEKGGRGRKAKRERPWDGKKLEKQEGERNQPKITSVKSSLLRFLKPQFATFALGGCTEPKEVKVPIRLTSCSCVSDNSA